MFVAAKDKLFSSITQNIATAQKHYTQDYSRKTTTAVRIVNCNAMITYIFMNIHVLVEIGE